MNENLFYIGNFKESLPSEADEGRYLKEAEMFSTGVHRGVEYTEDDINALVGSFSADEDIPVQIDHSESARDTVGYIREAFAKDGKLMGKLEILDKQTQERIDMGLMKKLSVSFYLQHSEEGFKPHKIREVSLVAFPQVKGARLFSENGYVSDYETKGGKDTMAQENKAQFSQEDVTKAVEEANATLLAQYNELSEKVEALVEANAKFSESEVTHKVEKFAEDKLIVPAQKTALTELLGSFSEEQATLFEQFMSNSGKVDLSEQGEFEQEDGSEKDQRTQEQKDFDAFYEEYASKHGSKL